MGCGVVEECSVTTYCLYILLGMKMSDLKKKKKKKNLYIYIYISLGFARYRILTHLSRLKFSPTDTSR